MRKISIISFFFLLSFVLLPHHLFSQKAETLSPISSSKNEISVCAGTFSGCYFIYGIGRDIIHGIAGAINHSQYETKWLGSYGIDYYYQHKKWVRFGAKVVFEGARSYERNADNQLVYREFSSLITLMPSIQFSYLNRSLVKLYSGIDVGATFFLQIAEKQVDIQPLFAANVTLLGIRVGNDKIYGLSELNVECKM